ncbi:ATP-grasp domain-containing protein [Verminephrobacter eiseniae]|uniref:ATP-grasp domain-containing protein n=1 Tax=Verminephrobacter eiseniae TaxID=364317 RepID=UPI0022378AEA|nr:ATP-grasp domain-containing protein [Verminephrobacter eiseniae]
MATHGILLLSHCGFSFLEDLIVALESRSLRSYVLSSLPLAQHRPQRLADIGQKATRLYATEAHELTRDDIDRTLDQLRGAGEQAIACITVWEGYRGLMAHANAALRVPDLAPAVIDALRDKLGVRNRLNDAGLSGVRAQLLTPELLVRLRAGGGRYFIKPVSGIASYGAFPLRADTTWDAIQNIRNEARDDIVYRLVVNEARDFLVEDYLAGREFSFELIVADGHVHIVGIHEKCEVTEAASTVLEDCCTSPPHSIGRAAVAAGIAWVRSLFAHLALDWGCFHVEGRFDGDRWDLIEINPRVGGSLISHSVKALNGEHSVLELWVDLLAMHAAGHTTSGRYRYLDRLAALSYADDGAPRTDRATFFRVYFAGPGKVAQIAVRETDPAPILSHILLKPGDEIANTAREVFLGQLLWQLTRPQRDDTLQALLRNSDGAIDIRYVQAEKLLFESVSS